MHTLQQLRAGELAGSKTIKISEALKDFPVELYELADTLEILDLSGNQLSYLPDNFQRLKNLRILFLSDNHFTQFPTVLSKCAHLEMIGFKANQIKSIPEDSFPPKLRWLILTNNQIDHLPTSIAACANMQKLMLAGNKLKHLPEEMSSLHKLELLRISANRFDSLPDWLLTLPRLSWLACAGNAFSEKKYAGANLKEIFWNELHLKEELGQGASGIITKASWKSNWPANNSREVAVKVFKGEVTSDGLPSDEMNACIAAGTHPNLVKVLGKIALHPNHKKGLVFDLIDPSYKNLGGPPSFSTCTRDVFKEGTSFSIETIREIASGIASASLHLHSKGIMHGDLYAHNILIDDHAHPLFGDFGAAAFYNTKEENVAPLLQRLEVRAFGCLLDDLLMHVAEEDQNKNVTQALLQLRDDCMQPEVNKRPDFATICSTITQLN